MNPLQMIKLIDTINVENILTQYQQLENTIQWTDYGHKGRQAGLQYVINEDPWTSAVGRSHGSEFEHTNLNPFFKDTIFEEMIDKYKLFRTRLMWVSPYACYSMHRDQTPRIHIPLITNPECYFVFKEGLISHIPAGNVNWVDTTKFHTFMNCSNSLRLHLVGVVEK
jgi:hypothetical protein